MQQWSEGYVTNLAYTYHYFPEMNPLEINLAFLNAGISPPKIENACELGFGNGVSLSIHAAASTVSWHGTDFNPSQVAFAQELNKASGAGAKLFDESFIEFCSRKDLPEFDYIALHGVWSWISDSNRKTIVEFLRNKLKVGGVLYISYNTFPGWSAEAPLRHLLTEYANKMESDGEGATRRIENAFNFSEKILDTKPHYSNANPSVQKQFQKLKGMQRNYIAHEFFNQDWHPMYFADTAALLDQAKLSFACSANYLDYVGQVNLTPEQRKILSEISDPLFRETVRDFMVNQRFRRDYWIKGPRTLALPEREQGIKAQKVILSRSREDISLTFKTITGEATLQPAIYDPILNMLSDLKLRTISEIESSVKNKNIDLRMILEAIFILHSKGDLAMTQDESQIKDCKDHVESLNKYIMNMARNKSDLAFLASPVTGGGIMVSHVQQLFILAMQEGLKTPQQWVDSAWDIFTKLGIRLVVNGKTLEKPEENKAELNKQAILFKEKGLTILKALQVIK